MANKPAGARLGHGQGEVAPEQHLPDAHLQRGGGRVWCLFGAHYSLGQSKAASRARLSTAWPASLRTMSRWPVSPSYQPTSTWYWPGGRLAGGANSRPVVYRPWTCQVVMGKGAGSASHWAQLALPVAGLVAGPNRCANSLYD